MIDFQETCRTGRRASWKTLPHQPGAEQLGGVDTVPDFTLQYYLLHGILQPKTSQLGYGPLPNDFTPGPGGQYQPLNANLTALAGLVGAADFVPYFTGSGLMALTGLTPAARSLLDDTTAQAQRTSLQLAAINAQFNYASPANGSVGVLTSAVFPFTISGLRGLRTSAGTLTLTVSINGTPVTGLSAIAVTTTPQSPNATAANSVAIGDRVTVTIASVSSAADLEFTIAGNR